MVLLPQSQPTLLLGKWQLYSIFRGPWGSFLISHFFFFHIPHLVGCEIHWNTSQMWSFLTPSIRTFLRSTCLNCSFLFNSQFWDMFSTHQMGLSLRIYVILFHSSFLGPLFPSHSEFLLKSLLWPYCPCMLWPWLFLWSYPLSLTSLHSALDPCQGSTLSWLLLQNLSLECLFLDVWSFAFLFHLGICSLVIPSLTPSGIKTTLACYVFMIYCLSLLTGVEVSWKAECHIHGQMPSIKNSPWHIEGAH